MRKSKYTKEVMKTKFKIPSPNLADSVKMLWRTLQFNIFGKVKMPTPLKPMGQTSRHNTRRKIRS